MSWRTRKGMLEHRMSSNLTNFLDDVLFVWHIRFVWNHMAL